MGMAVLMSMCSAILEKNIKGGLAIVGQLFFSTIIDSFGLMSIKKTPFDKRKIVGFVVIAAGIVCLIMF